MSQNGNEDVNNITSLDTQNLELIFSASNDIKNEISKTLTYNNDQILKTLNFLLLLAGIYITLLIFIYNPQQNERVPILWPGILSIFFLLIAIIRAIVELFPVPSVPIILPRVMYTLISKTRKESLKLIIPTYLNAANEIWIKAEEKNFSRHQIVLFILISLTNFLLFGIYCILRSYEVYLNILAIIFSIGFIIFYLWFVKTRRIKLTDLKGKLEKDQTKKTGECNDRE